MSATPTPGQPVVGHRGTVNFGYGGKLVHNEAANLEPAEEPRRQP